MFVPDDLVDPIDPPIDRFLVLKFVLLAEFCVCTGLYPGELGRGVYVSRFLTGDGLLGPELFNFVLYCLL